LGGERAIYRDGWIANTKVVLALWQNDPGVKLENPLEKEGFRHILQRGCTNAMICGLSAR
jgi:hypothetical protein